ncbi:trace amine-associated receptor 13c-like [Amia ocellicauda]|uniref:trace amine-associated receptor 13c-like n=1 Tax=Amia ocellicauda TaxID=2972642 RepID=UPI0034649480
MEVHLNVASGNGVYKSTMECAVQYCFQSSNSSCPKEARPTAVYVVMYISAAAVVMLTVCGNLLVIISISHFKQLHTPTNLLLCFLAVADLLVGVIVMPFLILMRETCWYFGETSCLIYTALAYGLTSISVINVACIAIDRYFAVCDPLLYSTKITMNITRSVILLNWSEKVKYLQTTLGVTVGVFLLCLVPWYIYTLINANARIFSSFAIHFLSWLVYFNSSINPLIYALLYPWFRKSVKMIVTCRICHPASSLMNLFQEKQ